MKTITPKQSEIKKDWYQVDAQDIILGRLSSRVAAILRGKNKPYFAPNIDTGDFVIVFNAEKIKLSGNKELNKIYKRYSGYPGGLKNIEYKRMQEKKPEQIIIHAVKGMLPKGPLGKEMLKKLKVYAGPMHPHSAQKPITLDYKEL